MKITENAAGQPAGAGTLLAEVLQPNAVAQDVGSALIDRLRVAEANYETARTLLIEANVEIAWMRGQVPAGLRVLAEHIRSFLAGGAA